MASSRIKELHMGSARDVAMMAGAAAAVWQDVAQAARFKFSEFNSQASKGQPSCGQKTRGPCCRIATFASFSGLLLAFAALAVASIAVQDTAKISTQDLCDPPLKVMLAQEQGRDSAEVPGEGEENNMELDGWQGCPDETDSLLRFNDNWRNIRCQGNQKGIKANYLRVRVYQKGIKASYLRVPMYQEGIKISYPRVLVYQKGIKISYLRGPMYQEGIKISYPRVLVYQKGIKISYLRGPMYQEGIKISYLRVLVYQEGIMACYLRVLAYQEGHSQTAQQWLGENGEKDRMALLADGITQLQEAMLKQYDKAREGDRSPQNIKPGTSILPTLKDVTAETSSVDIMDWFELIDAPMSDLSEGSAGWWRAVVKEAHRAYGVWTLASPVERLTVAPDVGELEAGQWSRVNSRAASMIVMALSDQVKQEVDTNPSYENVEGYYSSANNADFADLSRGLEACKFFGRTAKGCVRCSKCPFSHSWEGLDKKDRCLLCGGKGHMQKECPNNLKKYTPPTSNGSTPKHGSERPQAAPTSSSTTTTKTVRIDDQPEAVDPQPRGGEATLSGGELRDVLADVGRVLKSMTATSLKKVSVSDQEMPPLRVENEVEISVEEDANVKAANYRGGKGEESGPNGLLDSGASHAMRQAQPEEYGCAVPVKVTLAGEDEKILKQNMQGTILIQEEHQVQPIVPLGALIEELGYSLHWTPTKLKLSHPEKGSVRVRVNNHCPEVAACEALSMIKELEMKQVAELNNNVNTLKARLEMIRKEEQREWPELLREYTSTGSRSSLLKALMKCPFTKGLPTEVHSLMLEEFEPKKGEVYLKALPLTRRMRRLMMSSKKWVVNLNVGKAEEKEDPFSVVSRNGKVFLEVNYEKSRLWDLHKRGAVYQMLLWAASAGRISDVIGCPANDTWVNEATPEERKAATPRRTDEEPFGLKDLPPLQQQRLDRETAGIAKQMLIWMMSSMCSLGPVGFMMELPADVEESESDPGHASIWQTELWKAFKGVTGMRMVSFNMGDYGHRARRPTTAATNYPLLYGLGDASPSMGGYIPSSLLSKREMSQWPRRLKGLVLQAIEEGLDGSFAEEEELMKAGLRVSKLTKDQKMEWKQHLLNDHQPYRADCAVCINAQAYGYQHRRRKMPGLYTVALDLAGPFKQKGRDTEFDDYKYVMVAAYRCPRNYLCASSLPDYAKEHYAPEDMDDLDEDPLELEDEDMGGGTHTESEESDGEPFGPETLEEAVEDMKQAEELSTIYLTRPLRRRTTPHVLQAAKEILIQLRQSGLHVDVVHTDRAREFKAKSFKEWIVDSSLRHTKTAGGDPAGNATAELGVKWAKGRMRALLRASSFSPKEWPLAINHASASLWAKAFPFSGWTAQPATTFGNEVWFRSKIYQGKAEKKHEAAGTRWKKGWYGGPAMDVKRGHVILRDDGGLTVAKSVKFDVMDTKVELKDLLPPAIAEGLPDEILAAKRPPTKEELKEEIEFRARNLYENGSFEVEKIEELYGLLEALGDTDRRVSKKASVSSWYSGAFVHGGVAGLRNNTKEFPWTTLYLTSAAKRICGDVGFTALGVVRNTRLGLHRDSHNVNQSKNYVIPLKSFQGGAVWVQDERVDPKDKVIKTLPNGKEIPGRMLEMEVGKEVSFSPRLWHEVQPWEGDRLVLLLFTPRGTKLSEEKKKELSEAGFNVDHLLQPDEESEEEEEEVEQSFSALQGEISVKMLRADEFEEFGAFVEMEDEEFLKGDDNEDTVIHDGKNCESTAKFLRKAEVQYTPDIEELLVDLKKAGKPLEVTHNVSLGDVRRNIDKWKESAFKEYHNLKDVKKAFSVKKRKDLPANCRIVPCKGVYTVKPDSGGYRRKTRFVACGNHVPDEGAVDLFAAGVDATSLRTMMAFNAKRKDWMTGTTDVRQAFVLAKWLGQPVAMEPPAIAYELGLAERGDMWYVEQAIYGLRESPALWSHFRDGELKKARWKSEIDGELTTMKLEQLVTDDQIWRIVREDNTSSEVYGYVLVYIDDLLIQAGEPVLRTLYQWVAEKWEVDALDVLTPEHPIRFLGMEIHKTEEGFELGQEGFVRELLRSYKHCGARSTSQGPRELLILSDEEEKALLEAEPADSEGKENEIKQAQKRVGELMWLMSRTRPDLQYIVALMSSRLLRTPELVNRIGQRLLDYLNETIGYRIKLVQDEEEDFALNVFTDSSFAPSGGRSHGASAVFLGRSPLTWRSSRQTLVTLSTAESELIEGIEGTLLAMSTKGVLQELFQRELQINLYVDNQAAVTLLTSTSGSWRTRHLKLRAHWIKERIKMNEVFVRHIPGAEQKADLGTKPFTRARLKELVALWNMVDATATTPTASTKTARVDRGLMMKLLMLCQVCGTRAEKEDIAYEIPWDLYVAVVVLAVAVIGVWEGMKSCSRFKTARLKALRMKANKSGKLSKAELKELQRLLALQPADLGSEQMKRMYELKERFEQTMPLSSPVPTVPPDIPMGSTSSSSTFNKQPKPVEKCDKETQADYVPAFERVHPPIQPEVRMFEGPFTMSQHGDKLHLFQDCWGLRNASRTHQVTLCRCCVQNRGNRIY
ncbi:GIP [Symbiodinium sp. KB8]|nr:GIP [Symbiodinium sp. KB8]